MGVMEVLTAMLTITLPIVATVLLSNYQTQRIIEATNRQTQSVLKKLERCLLKMSRTQEEIKELQRETNRLQREMHRCLLKLDFGFKANAAMHGWRRVDEVSPEEVARLPEPKVYDAELRICYYKPA
jgi:biopolymer transport protein ExbB/TolQ